MDNTGPRKALLASAAVALLASASTAFAAEPVAKWCSGVKIAAFPGGPQGGVFANNVYNGFKQAELDLGPQVTYYFSDWDPNKMLTQIKQAIATKVDGIATYGFGGDDATDPLVDQAFAQGTIFTTLNTSLPKAQPKYSAKGLGFLDRPGGSRGDRPHQYLSCGNPRHATRSDHSSGSAAAHPRGQQNGARLHAAAKQF